MSKRKITVAVIEGEYYLTGSKLRCKTDDEVRKFLHVDPNTMEIEFKTEAPTKPLKTYKDGVLNITKKEDGYYLGQQLIGTDEEKVRLKFKSQPYSLVFHGEKSPDAFEMHIYDDSVRAYTSDAYRLRTEQENEKSPEAMRKFIEKTYGQTCSIRIRDFRTNKPKEQETDNAEATTENQDSPDVFKSMSEFTEALGTCKTDEQRILVYEKYKNSHLVEK